MFAGIGVLTAFAWSSGRLLRMAIRCVEVVKSLKELRSVIRCMLCSASNTCEIPVDASLKQEIDLDWFITFNISVPILLILLQKFCCSDSLMSAAICQSMSIWSPFMVFCKAWLPLCFHSPGWSLLSKIICTFLLFCSCCSASLLQSSNPNFLWISPRSFVYGEVSKTPAFFLWYTFWRTSVSFRPQNSVTNALTAWYPSFSVSVVQRPKVYDGRPQLSLAAARQHSLQCFCSDNATRPGYNTCAMVLSYYRQSCVSTPHTGEGMQCGDLWHRILEGCRAFDLTRSSHW